jgi:hypothetical protein
MTEGAPTHADLDVLHPLLSPQATVVDAFKIANEIYKNSTLPAISLAERELAFIPGRSPNAARPVYPRRVLDQAEFGTGMEDKDDVVKHDDIKPNPEQKQIPSMPQAKTPISIFRRRKRPGQAAASASVSRSRLMSWGMRRALNTVRKASRTPNGTIGTIAISVTGLGSRKRN